jgi:glutamine amidotransferase-like uncharacterized protein
MFSQDTLRYDSDLDGVDVAVYEGGSSSISSREALVQMFAWMNASVTVLSATSIKNGALDDYDLLVVPGGFAGDYNDDLGGSGRSMILSFIQNGGAFFGVCAGAYFGCDWIIWEETPIEYYLDLFSGCGIGAIDEIEPWPGYAMCDINVARESELIDLSTEPENHTVMYYGGPYFVPDNPEDVEIIARYAVNNEPAMIALEYEAGRVFLSGPHPEWEEDSDRDGQAWPDSFDDIGSEWPMMLSVARWLTEQQTTSTTTTTETSTTTTTTATTPTTSSTVVEAPGLIEPIIILIAVVALSIVSASLYAKKRR